VELVGTPVIAVTGSHSCITPCSCRIQTCSGHANVHNPSNIASYLHGAAHMSAHTNASIWTAIVNNLLDTATTTFFSPFPNATGIMYEPICEKQAACSTDQSSFKGSLANWMGKTAVLVPSVSQKIMALLGSSAQGAAAGCSGGNGTCGTKWYVGGFDGQVGFGQQLSALDAVLSLLVGDAPELAVLA